MVKHKKAVAKANREASRLQNSAAAAAIRVQYERLVILRQEQGELRLELSRAPDLHSQAPAPGLMAACTERAQALAKLRDNCTGKLQRTWQHHFARRRAVTQES